MIVCNLYIHPRVSRFGLLCVGEAEETELGEDWEVLTWKWWSEIPRTARQQGKLGKRNLLGDGNALSMLLTKDKMLLIKGKYFHF